MGKLDLDKDFFCSKAAGELGLEEEIFVATTNNNNSHE
jgi:hypothetical protein